MPFRMPDEAAVTVAMADPADLLGTFSSHPVVLDDVGWPSVEHYVSGEMFAAPELRELIRAAPAPAQARRLAKQHRRRVRGDWKRIAETVMTRGVYIKCRAHAEVAAALLATGERKIVEISQYDYHWGCGRDGRGRNAYGLILMAVRFRLRQERALAGPQAR